MIPLRDNIQSRTVPFVNYAIIGINILAFFYELSLGAGELNAFFYDYGVVPAKVTGGGFEPYPFLTSMFLHGGWMHIIGNMLFLWIFGDNVEDRMGHVVYVFFYLLSGIGATALHIVTDTGSRLPTIGASGAIAGVMGAYFVLYPKARVLSAVIIFYFIRLIEIPAVVFLGIWFGFQFLSGLIAFGAEGGGVAFWAHIGGFLVGIVGGFIAKVLTDDNGSPPTRIEVITRDGKRYYH